MLIVTSPFPLLFQVEKEMDSAVMRYSEILLVLSKKKHSQKFHHNARLLAESESIIEM